MTCCPLRQTGPAPHWSTKVTGGTSSRCLKLICEEPELRDARFQPQVTLSPPGRGRSGAALTVRSRELRSVAMGTGLRSPKAFLESTATTCGSSPASVPRQTCSTEPTAASSNRAPEGSWHGSARLSPFSAAPGAPRSHLPPPPRSSGRPCPAGSLGDRAGAALAQAAPSQKQKKGAPPTQKPKGGFPRCTPRGKRGVPPSPTEQSHHPPARPGAPSSVPQSATTGRSSERDRERRDELLILQSQPNSRDSSRHRAASPCPHSD